MIAESRREADAERRETAVRLVRESGRPLKQVAAELGIPGSTLRGWVRRDDRNRERRRQSTFLNLAVTATAVCTPAAAGLGAIAVGIPVGAFGLVATWVAGARCWRVTRRPRLFRLVWEALGQLFAAFLLVTVGMLHYQGEVDALTLVLALLLGVTTFIYKSFRFAGFLRGFGHFPTF